MTAHVAKESMTFPAAGGVRGGVGGRSAAFGGRVLAAVQWVADLPRRRAVLEELGRLSDHELADIGLTRADLPRVFDPAFVHSRNFARKAGA
jgi:uncharacterized protein YjiS (DUF1127 family)